MRTRITGIELPPARPIFQKSFNDDFNRANTAFGGAGTTTGVGNSWIDKNGNVAKIVSNQLSLTSDGAANQYLRDFVVRPNTEVFKDGRLEVDSAAVNWTPGSNLTLYLRYQSASGNCYIAKIAADGSDLQIYSILANVPTLVVGAGTITNFNAAKTYRVRFECYGTQFILQIYDITGGGTPVWVGGIAGTSSAITAAGTAGVCPQWSGTGLTHTLDNVSINWKSNFAGGCLGDSIFANIPTSGDISTGEALVESVANRLGRTYTFVNQSVAGRATTDVAAGSGNLAAIRAAFHAGGVTDVFLLLGSNDAVTGILRSQATYLANMTAIIAELTADGFRVHVLGILWAVTGSGGPRDGRSNDLTKTYNAGLPSLCDGINVFMGDVSAYDWCAANPNLFLDGIHPNLHMRNDLVDTWADGSYKWVTTP